MKLKIHKNWNPMEEIFQLSKTEIESQVLNDLRDYQKIYSQKYNKIAPNKFDVDNFVNEKWGFEIIFQSIEQTESESILGYLDPEKKQIIVDPDQCSNRGRINFTIAHEAGHLSLHALMLRIENGQIVGWDNQPISPQFSSYMKVAKLNINQKRIEWQANKYASSLLAPKFKVYGFLEKAGLVERGRQISPLDLSKNAKDMMKEFGLSRQALEIRLSDLGLDLVGRLY